MISTTRRTFSFTLYFTRRFEESASAFDEAIELSEKNGDINSLLIAQVYISIAHRRLKDRQAVHADTQALMGLLQKLSRNPEYNGVVEANLAWLAYCEGNLNDALHRAQTANEIWQSLTSPYPMQWVGLIVLLALAVEAKKMDEVLIYARSLLHPIQQSLEPDVESALLSTLEADPVDRELVLRLCHTAVEVAKQDGYL